MAKLEFTVSVFGPLPACESLAKNMQKAVERSWVNANGKAKPTTTMLIGKNQIEREDAAS